MTSEIPSSESSLRQKIEALRPRVLELESLLSHPDVAKNVKEYRLLSSEHARISKLLEIDALLTRLRSEIQENESLYREVDDLSLLELVKEELERSRSQIVDLEKQILTLLVPPHPDDDRPIILELRAGTGGEEAALFVAECCRMYRMYAEKKGWSFSPLSTSASDLGGLKEGIYSIQGPSVHKIFKFEGGTHRVQRVPQTESQGRVHTSTITVAILLEPSEEEEIFLDPKDLSIDTCRASGAGGQHVNKTDSAVRITHLPTGIVVFCQEERSQIKNRERALSVLKARILDRERQAQQAERAQIRSEQVGSGERSERIRTYNFPQNRLTDHRIHYTSYNLDRVMEGHLEELFEALLEDEAKHKLTNP